MSEATMPHVAHNAISGREDSDAIIGRKRKMVVNRQEKKTLIMSREDKKEEYVRLCKTIYPSS